MVSIKEALTFDDVTLSPSYSEVLPSEVDTSIKLTKYLKLKTPLLSAAMDTVTESKMAIAIAKAGGIGVIHRNLDIKKQIVEIRKVKKQKLLVGAAVGAGPQEFKRAKAILKEGVDLIVVDTAHGHTKKVLNMLSKIKKLSSKTPICVGNIATGEAAKALVDAGADGWIAGLVNALPVESVKLFDLARGDDRAACRELYEWFLPLLRLDAVPEFVHLVKLCQSEFGLGNERLRMPRMALEGEQRDRALMIIAEAKMNHARI